MLYRRGTGELVGCGERVPNPYDEGDLILSSWKASPLPRKRKNDPVTYDVEVVAYRNNRHGQAEGYDTYAPYELGLEYRDGVVSQKG